MPSGFGRRRAREQQRVRVDGNGLRRAVVGDAGLADEDIADLARQLDDRTTTLERQRRTGFVTLPSGRVDLRRAAQLAEQVRGAFEDLVVVAGGRLALGIHAVASALTPPNREAQTSPPGALRVHVADDLDPESFATLLAGLDLRRTLFNIVSSTNDGLETMGRFLIIRDRLLRELGAVAYKQHVVITTAAGNGPLRQIVNDEGFRDLSLSHDGEDAFALLSAAALFPASCAGTDIADIVAGATAMAERCHAPGTGMTPAELLAMAHLHAAAQGLSVVTSGLSSLHTLAAWIEHGCAGIRGASANAAGTRPLARRVTLFIAVERHRHDLEIPKAYQDLESIGYLGGQGLGALAELHREALEMACWSVGQPTMTLRCPEITAYVIGQIVYLAAAAAALARTTLGVVSDERDRAARLANGLAGRPGYEAERADGQRWAARREARYVA